MKEKCKWTDYFKELWFSRYLWCIVIVCLATLAILNILFNFGLIDFDKIPNNYENFLAPTLLLIFVIIAFLIYKKTYLYFKVPYFSVFDKAWWTIFALAVVIAGSLYLWGFNRICSVIIVLVISLGVLLIRIILYRNVCNTKPIQDYSCYSLETLLNGKVDVTNNLPIIISDKPSEIDLFNMDDAINQIKSAILYSSKDDVKIIGVNGEWGSGKTTLIQLSIKAVLEESKGGFVASSSGLFDMWYYGSNEAMLFSLYDYIFSIYNLHSFSIKNRKIIEVLFSLVGNKFSTKFSYIMSNIKDGNSLINNEKERINKIISQQEKRAIIVIDNIDRAENKTIVFLLRLLSTFLNLHGIIFILAYDRDEIKFSLKGEYADTDLFLDKVITREVLVPEPNSEARYETFNKVLTNILLSYGVKEDEIELYEELLDATINITANIRKMILIINNSFAETFTKDSHDLFLRDLLAMNIVKELNLKLWKEIRDNKMYFITSNLGTKKDKYDFTDISNYYKNLHERYSSYIPLLKVVFPEIDQYLNRKTSLNHMKNVTKEDKIHHYKSITSGIYFESYFIFGYSKIDKLSEDVKAFVEMVNKNIYEDIEYYIVDLFNQKSDYVKYFYIMLEYFLDDIDKESFVFLSKILINHYYDFERLSLNFELSTQSTIEVIIARLISLMNKNEVEVIRDYLFRKPGFILVVDAIYYWLDAFMNDGGFHIGNIVSLDHSRLIFKNLLEDCCTNITNQNINLYDLKYFHIGNVWALFRFFKPYNAGNDLEKEELTKYMNSCLNVDTVYRILSDVVHKTTYYGDKIFFRYSFNDEDFNEYLVDYKKIEKILNDKKPTTDAEKFLHELFNLYLQYKSIEDEDKRKKFINYIELDKEFKFKFE